MKKGETKKTLFILKRLISSHVLALIYSVLLIAVFSTAAIFLYSWDKEIAFIDTLTAMYHFIFESQKPTELGSLGFYMIVLLIIGGSPLVLIFMCNSQLKKKLGVNVFTVTKWYFLYSFIYSAIVAILKKVISLDYLFDTSKLNDVLENVNSFIQKYPFITLLLLLPPFFLTIKSIKNNKLFNSIYTNLLNEKQKLKDAKNAERERIKAEKDRVENQKVIDALRAKATVFNEKIEAKMRSVVIPTPDTDDMI